MEDFELCRIKNAAVELGFEIRRENQNQIRIQKNVNGQVIEIHLRVYERLVHGSHTLCTLPDDLAENLLLVMERRKAEGVELRVFEGKNGAANILAALYQFRNLDHASFGACLNVFFNEILILRRVLAEADIKAMLSYVDSKIRNLRGSSEKPISQNSQLP